MTFSKKVNDEAGEPTADAGAYLSGTRQSNYQASFDFASVTPATEQPGFLMSVSPDRGDGARMSYVRFDDTPAGWNLTFIDYKDAAPLGSGGNLDDGCGAEDDFISTPIATGLSRSPHNIRFAMKFVPGPHNDIVSISLDGSVVHTGTSWEDYYRYCGESGGGTGRPLADQSRTVRALAVPHCGNRKPEPRRRRHLDRRRTDRFGGGLHDHLLRRRHDRKRCQHRTARRPAEDDPGGRR